MTPDEQRALVQFFGTVHAQAKQTDQMIVGNSQFVKPVSPYIQQQLEQALRIPVQEERQEPLHPQYTESPVIAEPTIQDFKHVEQPVSYISPPLQVQEAQPVASVDMVKVLEQINLNLTRIGDILERQNGIPKKTKNTQSN
jgi:hypothetical protein